jgi:hypothetical protein
MHQPPSAVYRIVQRSRVQQVAPRHRRAMHTPQPRRLSAGTGEPLVRPVRVLGLAHVSTRSTPLNPAACRPAPGAWPQLVHADPDFDTAKCSLDCVEAISDCMLLTPERKAYKPSRVW